MLGLADSEPHGGLSPDDWLARFATSAAEKVRVQLSSEEDAGELLDLAIETRKDGIWSNVTFTMHSTPGVTYIRSQRVMPDLSAEWDPEFAATLFETHLIEWFYTDGKRRAPDASGTVRG